MDRNVANLTTPAIATGVAQTVWYTMPVPPKGRIARLVVVLVPGSIVENVATEIDIFNCAAAMTLSDQTIYQYQVLPQTTLLGNGLSIVTYPLQAYCNADNILGTPNAQPSGLLYIRISSGSSQLKSFLVTLTIET